MSLIEVMIGCGVLSVLLGMALPVLLTTRDDWSVRAAARHVASRAMLARAQAVHRGAAVGLRFESTPDGYRFGSYVDGDGDGIRTTDIADGVDAELHPAQRLADRFPSVSFALVPGLPPVGSGKPAGATFDPIRLGPSDILTYTPLGTSTSGSLYLKGAYWPAVRCSDTRNNRSSACAAVRCGGWSVESALRKRRRVVRAAAKTGVSVGPNGSVIPKSVHRLSWNRLVPGIRYPKMVEIAALIGETRAK